MGVLCFQNHNVQYTKRSSAEITRSKIDYLGSQSVKYSESILVLKTKMKKLGNNYRLCILCR